MIWFAVHRHVVRYGTVIKFPLPSPRGGSGRAMLDNILVLRAPTIEHRTSDSDVLGPGGSWNPSQGRGAIGRPWS